MYQPATGFSGTDSFTYTIKDNAGGSGSGTVTVQVTPNSPAPTLNRLSASMVTPANGWAHYGNSTSHGADPAWVTTTNEISALATSLGAGRAGVTAIQYSQNVFDYVRNTIATEFRFGLGKGGRGALIDQSGTPFDQAELMVKLLRQGGVTASYQLANATLSPLQFGLWTGLFTNLNPSTQSFSISAQAACQFLADGGIPAIINNVVDNGTQNYCNQQVSGNLSAVTIAHIWVSANGYRYDPSFKQFVLKSGIDLAAAMGCGSKGAATCGSLAQAAMLTGALGSTTAPYVKSLNESAVIAKIAGFATSLQAAIQTSHPTAVLSDIIGGTSPNLAYAPVAGLNLPYSITAPAAGPSSWSGDIPDQFRTAVSYQVCGQTFSAWADQLAGRRIRQWETAFPTTLPQSNSYTVSLFVEDQDVLDCNATYGSPTISTASVLMVTPPYATASYGVVSMNMDTIDGIGQPGPQLSLLVQLGEASESSSSYYGDLLKGDPTPFHPVSGATSNMCNTAAGIECSGDFSLQGVQFFAAQSHGAGIAGAISGAAIRHHARIGYIGNFGSVSGGVSTESLAGDSATATAAFELFAHTSSALEAALTGGIEPASGSTTFVLDNRAGETIVDVSPSNMSAVIPSLTNYGGRTTALQALANAGFESIIPQNGFVPQTAWIGSTGSSSEPDGDFMSPDYEIQANSAGLLLLENFKGALVGGGPDPTGDVLATVKRGQEIKTAINQGVSVDMASGQMKLNPPPDLVTGSGGFPASLPFQRTYLSNGGVVEHRDVIDTAAADNGVVYALWTYAGPDAGNMDHLGGGWQHNYQVTANWSMDAPMALGQNRAVDATAMIAVVFANSLLLKSPTFDSRLTALFGDYWMAKQFMDNAFFVRIGAQTLEFTRLPNRSFLAPVGSKATLTQTAGATLTPSDGALNYTFVNASSGCLAVFFNYNGLTFTLVNPDGDSITFDEAQSSGATGDCTGIMGSPVFKADNWVFPDGNVVNFQYNAITNWVGNTQLNYNILSKVSNSFGRSLSFADTAISYGTSPPTSAPYTTDVGWLINSVTDDSGRTVSFAESNCPTFYYNYGSAGASASAGAAAWACDTFTVTLPDSSVWTYDYTPGPGSPDPSPITRASYRLRRWYTALNTTTPYEVVAYDPLYRVSTATDPLGHVTTYAPSALFTTEIWKRTNLIDALGATSTQTFDQWNDLLQATDPLGRTRTYAYDNLHRKTQETMPLGDYITYDLYDARSNLLQSTHHPIAGSTDYLGNVLTPIVTTTSFGFGGDASSQSAPSTVLNCTAPSTCNKPASATDGRGSTTNYSWNATTGQLSQILKPADVNNNRPETDFYYTGAGGVSLLTSRKDLISASVSTTTGYVYGGAPNYNLQSATVDTTGLNLTTSFTFDAVGDLASVTDPLGQVSGALGHVQNYTWDSNRRLVFAIEANSSIPGNIVSGRVATRYTYNLNGQLTETDKGSTTQPNGSDFSAFEATLDAYDAFGNAVQTTVLNGPSGSAAMAVTQTSYDADNRPTCTAVRETLSVLASLPASACAQSTAADNDQISQITYDAAGQKITELRGVGSATPITYATYGYDLDGDVATIEDANSNLTTNTYDGFDRLRQVSFPSTTRGAGTSDSTDYEAYAYDANGNRLTLRRRDASVINYTYDALDRQVLKHFPANSAADVSTSYDLLGRRLTALYANVSSTPGVSWTWDNAGRRTAEVTNGRSMNIVYDAAGNRALTIWPDTQGVAYTFDGDNRFAWVGNGPVGIGFGYDAIGQLGWIGRSGSSTNIGFDADGHTTQIAHNLATSPVTFNYNYTPGGQVATAASGNALYDWQGGAAVTVNTTADGLNRNAAIAVMGAPCAPQGSGYDCNGNLTFDGVRTFTYDGENRLLSVSVAGSTVLALAYDPLGRLQQTTAGSTVTQYVYDGDALAAEYAGSSLVQRFVHGPGVDNPVIWYAGSAMTAANASYLIADRQGSIIATTNTAGTTTNIFTYDAYGVPSSWAVPGFGYTGQLALPQASLWHYKARAYDPVAGRFLQTDPVGYQSDLDLYAYTGNDPVNMSDPAGTEGEQDTGPGQTGDTHWDFVVRNSGGVSCSPNCGADAGAQNTLGSASKGSSSTSGASGAITQPSSLAPPLPPVPTSCQSCHSPNDQLVAADAEVGQIIVTAVRQRVDLAIEIGELIHQSLSPNQMNKAIKSGNAPRGVKRIDTGKVTGEQDHAHLDDGTAVNRDGSAKHGSPNLTDAIREWLKANGWNL